MPTLAFVAVDTAENEPYKVRQLDGRVRCNIGWELACSAAEALAEMYRKIYPQYSVATGVVPRSTF